MVPVGSDMGGAGRRRFEEGVLDDMEGPRKPASRSGPEGGRRRERDRKGARADESAVSGFEKELGFVRAPEKAVLT